MPQTVLIVEDNTQFRSALADSLRDAGFEVLQAETTKRAMHLFLNGTPDLVLLDLGIDGADGMQLLHTMKSTRGAIPVIIVSGRTHINDAIDAFKAGAWDYVTKPIPSLDVFINTLHNCLAQSNLNKRVQETQEHLYRLVQNLPVIIFIINRNLEFEFLNQTTEQILGYSPREIQDAPRAFLKYIVPEDRHLFLDGLKHALSPKAGEFRLEFRFMHKKGYQIHLQAQSIAYPKNFAGVPDRIEGMIRDVTRNVYMEKILLHNEKLNMLRTITEEVAHEIRNPLVSLGGFARQLRARYPGAMETAVILDECTRLERLVQRVSAYLEPFPVSLTACALPAAMAFIMRLLASRAERSSVVCSVELDDLAPVLADQELLHRILIYLVGHGLGAVRPHGSMRVTGVELNSMIHMELYFSPVQNVETDGNRLFMPFEDEESNLATCYRLVERLSGHLEMQPTIDTIRVLLYLPKYVSE